MNIYDRSSVGGHIGKLNALTSKLISDCTWIAQTLDCFGLRTLDCPLLNTDVIFQIRL
jgi:hypothetical protein